MVKMQRLEEEKDELKKVIDRGHDALIVQEHRCVRIIQGMEQGVQGPRFDG